MDIKNFIKEKMHIQDYNEMEDVFENTIVYDKQRLVIDFDVILEQMVENDCLHFICGSDFKESLKRKVKKRLKEEPEIETEEMIRKVIEQYRDYIKINDNELILRNTMCLVEIVVIFICCDMHYRNCINRNRFVNIARDFIQESKENGINGQNIIETVKNKLGDLNNASNIDFLQKFIKVASNIGEVMGKQSEFIYNRFNKILMNKCGDYNDRTTYNSTVLFYFNLIVKLTDILTIVNNIESNLYMRRNKTLLNER